MPPRPILKTQPDDHQPLTYALPFTSCSLSQLLQQHSPHVHFPPTPRLARMEITHSSHAYDRAPIVVVPNDCEMPDRGGRSYDDGERGDDVRRFEPRSTGEGKKRCRAPANSRRHQDHQHHQHHQHQYHQPSSSPQKHMHIESYFHLEACLPVETDDDNGDYGLDHHHHHRLFDPTKMPTPPPLTPGSTVLPLFQEHNPSYGGDPGSGPANWDRDWSSSNEDHALALTPLPYLPPLEKSPKKKRSRLLGGTREGNRSADCIGAAYTRWSVNAAVGPFSDPGCLGGF